VLRRQISRVRYQPGDRLWLAALSRLIPRDLIYAASRAAITGQRPVLDALAQDPEISKHLDRAALARLLDPRHYVGLSASMVDRVLAHGTRHNRDHSAAAHPAGRHPAPDSAAESPEQPRARVR